MCSPLVIARWPLRVISFVPRIRPPETTQSQALAGGVGWVGEGRGGVGMGGRMDEE